MRWDELCVCVCVCVCVRDSYLYCECDVESELVICRVHVQCTQQVALGSR